MGSFSQQGRKKGRISRRAAKSDDGDAGIGGAVVEGAPIPVPEGGPDAHAEGRDADDPEEAAAEGGQGSKRCAVVAAHLDPARDLARGGAGEAAEEEDVRGAEDH